MNALNDQLARALHTPSNLATLHDRSREFVIVGSGLVESAAADHPGGLEVMLASLHMPTSGIIVALPEDALCDPVTFVRSTISFSLRGYRVLATLRLSDAHADLEHVFLAEPHYVAIDAFEFATPQLRNELARARLRKTLKALHERGIRTLARGVEGEEQAAFARDAGFTLLEERSPWPPSRTRESRDSHFARS